jgi:polyribonucleotide nucleotidyltransferase
MEVKNFKTEFGGKPLSVELGRLGGQANGTCRVQYGETTILANVTMSNGQKDADYFPLQVEYEEKYYAAGKIKGSKWIKREGRPSEEAILTGRLIDRTLRPRFDHNIRNDVQVVVTVLSFDGINDPDIPAIFAASLAIMISDIPFAGPVAGIRVGRNEGKLVFNPTYLERETSDFDIVVAGTENKINMLEAGAKIVPEKDMADAVAAGFAELKKVMEFQTMIANDVSPVKKELKVFTIDEKITKMVGEFSTPLLEKAIYTKNKSEYVKNIADIREKTLAFIAEQMKDGVDKNKLKEANLVFEEEIGRIVHENIIKNGKRPDGRKMDELRTIKVEAGVIPHTHGSGLFNRGNTQALSMLTLAAPGLEQWIETMEIELTKKRFMHHYIFPPFSVGETGRLGFTGRREIGHGALAERALLPIIPAKDTFPYTIRVVSEILSSNGSSSMASVCGASIALMDGGVPIKTPAAGIAMGLILDTDGKNYKVLTDIQGPEDHHGDMDMKVAGTKDGVTAMQMDVKVEGIDIKILIDTLGQAKKARLEILEHIEKVISTPRADLSVYAPRVKIIKIDPSKIGAVIGPQGKVINDIIDRTGVSIDIEDDGSVFITSDDPEGMEKALKIINEITYEAKPGDEFEGKVSRLFEFGAMVEFISGKEGMVHVSEISRERIRKPADVLKIGQSVHVRVKNIDDMGRVNLTMKGLNN